jgi:alpha-galactosidase
MSGFARLGVRPVDRTRARVYEHGWQSWSPTTTYPVDATSYRPVRPHMDTMCYRPARPAPSHGFQGEGLLAVDPGDGGPVTVYAAPDPEHVPSIRAAYRDGHLSVEADGPVGEHHLPAPLPAALAAWADSFAAAHAVPAPRTAPTGWCSWYQYFTDVTEADVDENLAAIAKEDLPIQVVQIDDGWQAGIGDWLVCSDRFRSLPELAARIRDAGRRPGIWLAPFLVGARSALARHHPDWLVEGAGHNWDQDLYGLDTTRAGAAAYLREVFGWLGSIGFDYFKLDFLYAGALDDLSAYRAGLRLVREAAGPDAYLVGSGAPILSSAGLVDAMRVSADIAPEYEPDGGDPSRPSQFGATLSAVGRAFQHGRFWVNDPDCLIARPAVERRAEWSDVVGRYGGLRVSSDRIADLDDWGLGTTRRLLSEVLPPTPLVAAAGS